MIKFRSSFLGGYNKADVNSEISELNKKLEEYEAEKKRLLREAENAEERVSCLEKQISELTESNKRLEKEKSENGELFENVAKIYKRAYGVGSEIVCDSKETAVQLLTELNEGFENAMGDTAGLIGEYEIAEREINDNFAAIGADIRKIGKSVEETLKKAKLFAEIYGKIKNTVDSSVENSERILAKYEAEASEFLAVKHESPAENTVSDVQPEIANAETVSEPQPAAAEETEADFSETEKNIADDKPSQPENYRVEKFTPVKQEPQSAAEAGKTGDFTQFGRKSKISAQDRSELLRKALLKNGGN